MDYIVFMAEYVAASPNKLFAAWNNYCRKTNKTESLIYRNNLAIIAKAKRWDDDKLAMSTSNNIHYKSTDEFASVSPNGKVVLFNDTDSIVCPVDLAALFDYIVNNNDGLGVFGLE